MMTTTCHRLAVSVTMKMSNQPDTWRKFNMDEIPSSQADLQEQRLDCFHDKNLM
jgi:hypothetical protein